MDLAFEARHVIGLPPPACTRTTGLAKVKGVRWAEQGHGKQRIAIAYLSARRPAG